MGNKIGYENEKVYLGIDVHKKTYTFTAQCNDVIVKTATVPANPSQFAESLHRWFSGSKIFSVYEAGFGGFKLHRILDAGGIKNIVVNPASVEVAAKDKVKTDRRDSKKLAEQLATGRLTGIYIPTEKEELARLITRTREQILENRNRVSHQIKGRLHFFGLLDPDDKRVVNEAFIKDIESWQLAHELKMSLKLSIDLWRFLTAQLAELKIDMKTQSFEDAYNEALYQSVPGVGDVSARIFSNELGDLSKRFKNQQALFQFVGLVPTEYSSGESQRKGHISHQGSSRIRKALVECAWRAIETDGVLTESFNRIAARRGKKRAIVATARKLLGRMRACFATQTEYCVGLTA